MAGQSHSPDEDASGFYLGCLIPIAVIAVVVVIVATLVKVWFG